MGPRVIDQFTPGVVAMLRHQGDRTPASGASCGAPARAGAVASAPSSTAASATPPIIRRAGFPIFHRFTSPGDAVGRFNIVDFNCPVTIGGVRVEPGDYVFGDEDGVVIDSCGADRSKCWRRQNACSCAKARFRNSLGEGKALADLYLGAREILKRRRRGNEG